MIYTASRIVQFIAYPVMTLVDTRKYLRVTNVYICCCLLSHVSFTSTHALSVVLVVRALDFGVQVATPEPTVYVISRSPSHALLDLRRQARSR
jgi:hypothetical protein